jgi:hypothetical protein
VLADNGELLLKADETDRGSIRLYPAGPAMRLPTLLAGGSIGEVDRSSEKIFDAGGAHARCYSIKESPDFLANESDAQTELELLIMDMSPNAANDVNGA